MPRPISPLPQSTMIENPKRTAVRMGSLLTAALALSLALPSAFAEPQGLPGKQEKSVPTAKQDAPEKETVTLNFVNADLVQVIKTVGMITGKNFLIDPRVTGTVNIISNGPVARDLVYPTLLSALRLQGFAAVEEQGFIKIVPEADAKLNYSITSDKPIKGGGDKIVTQVYQLQYENAAQLLPVLRPLISPNNVIAAYPNNNTLVITDYAENIRRINKIIQSIDQPAQGEITPLKLQHASAVDVAQLLGKLLPEAAAQQGIPGATPKLLLTVDPRSNTIFVRSDNPSYVSRVRSLVTGMDTPEAATGNIHVVYLRNAEATKVAETLRGLLSGQSQGGQTSLGAAPATSFAPTQGGAPGGLAATAAPAASGSASQAVSSTIQAYAATNSLVIIAPDHLYNQLRSVIDKLDARRAQVFVEALIVEVNSSLSGEFGIQWQNLEGLNKDGTNVIGGTNFTSPATSANIIGVAQNITTIGSGFNIGIVRGTVNIPGIGNIINLGVLAKALESHGKTNILSTPNILTLDNEEAKIVVGQNVPFVTGSFAQSGGTVGGTVNPFQTIERKDVGLTLKVKPTVAEGGSIKLQLYQEASSVDTTINTAGAGLVTNKRSIESTVLVDDGQIIVLGGLIQDQTQDANSQVPVLGSIPILGNLFKSQTRSRTKSNLMIFLRPFVLRDDQSPNKLTGDRYDYIRNEQIKNTPDYHLLLPDIDGPRLPELPESSTKKNTDYTPPVEPLKK